MLHVFYWFVILTGLREAPQLASVLREMKEGLDVVRNKVEALTAKVPSLCIAASNNIILDSTLVTSFFVSSVRRVVLFGIIRIDSF